MRLFSEGRLCTQQTAARRKTMSVRRQTKIVDGYRLTREQQIVAQGVLRKSQHIDLSSSQCLVQAIIGRTFREKACSVHVPDLKVHQE